MLDKRWHLDGWDGLSGKNMESMTVKNSGCHAWRVPRFLQVKNAFCRLRKKVHLFRPYPTVSTFQVIVKTCFHIPHSFHIWHIHVQDGRFRTMCQAWKVDGHVYGLGYRFCLFVRFLLDFETVPTVGYLFFILFCIFIVLVLVLYMSETFAGC